eukprot:670835-Hanusia_phi.AAC.1
MERWRDQVHNDDRREQKENAEFLREVLRRLQQETSVIKVFESKEAEEGGAEEGAEEIGSTDLPSSGSMTSASFLLLSSLSLVSAAVRWSGSLGPTSVKIAAEP